MIVGRTEAAEKIESMLEWGGVKKDAVLLVMSGAALIASLAGWDPLPFDAAWVAIILCGVPIVLEASAALISSFDVKADLLVSIALIASVVIGEDFAAGEVAFIMKIGSLLEELTVAKARAGIEKLVRMTPVTARRIAGGAEAIVRADEVCVGDVLRVLPGETVPVDGAILSGRTSVDQSVMTGESLPVDKKEGDEVFSGTVNQFGSFDMRAAKVGEDSSIQRMIKLVQSADAGKAKIVGAADRWAAWIVAAALASAAAAWFLTGEAIRAVTVLVVFCPCALVLATPTAVMAAIGNATRHGFLVREGDALERLSSVSEVAFDKTGTLTHGKPRVTAVSALPDGPEEEELYRYAACAECRSEHPLGKAVSSSYRASHDGAVLSAENFQMLPGLGVTASVGGVAVAAGSEGLFAELGVELPDGMLKDAEEHLKRGCTVVFVTADGKAAGFVALADTLRRDAPRTVEGVKAAGASPVLLTGDNGAAARSIAAQCGITEIRYNCTPQGKLEWIGETQRGHGAVCMIGDGINDAPALKMAQVGIAMGGIGSDIAVDAADIVLVNDDLRELPHLLRLSKKMMRTIKSNIIFSMALNFAAFGLAAAGILNPVAGALVHNAGSVAVIINSALLLNWERR